MRQRTRRRSRGERGRGAAGILRTAENLDHNSDEPLGTGIVEHGTGQAQDMGVDVLPIDGMLADQVDRESPHPLHPEGPVEQHHDEVIEAALVEVPDRAKLALGPRHAATCLDLVPGFFIRPGRVLPRG